MLRVLAIGAAIGGLVTLLTRRSASLRPLTTQEKGRVAQLLPSVQKALEKLRYALADAGVQVFIGQTWQSREKAEEGFQAGRSATRKSWHRARRAIDLYVIDPATGKPDYKAVRTDLYRKMGDVAERRGWRWLGLKTITNRETGASFTDPYHVEWREGKSYTQALAEAERFRPLG